MPSLERDEADGARDVAALLETIPDAYERGQQVVLQAPVAKNEHPVTPVPPWSQMAAPRSSVSWNQMVSAAKKRGLLLGERDGHARRRTDDGALSAADGRR